MPSGTYLRGENGTGRPQRVEKIWGILLISKFLEYFIFYGCVRQYSSKPFLNIQKKKTSYYTAFAFEIWNIEKSIRSIFTAQIFKTCILRNSTVGNQMKQLALKDFLLISGQHVTGRSRFGNLLTCILCDQTLFLSGLRCGKSVNFLNTKTMWQLTFGHVVGRCV